MERRERGRWIRRFRMQMPRLLGRRIVALRRHLVWLAPAIVFALSLSHNLSLIDQTPFQPDETRWLNRAHYLRDLLDPFGATWRDQYLTRGQPPLGSYVTGLGLLVQGRDLTTNGVWDFTRGYEFDSWWNVAHGNMANAGDLLAARRTNAVVGALTALTVALVVSRCTHALGGLTGGLIFAFHPLQTDHATRALADPLLVLLVALATLAAMCLADRPTWSRALLLGGLLGLGASTKLSPLLIAGAMAAWGALLLALTWRSARRSAVARVTPAGRLGWMLFSVPVIAAAMLVVSYPYLWPDPLTRTYRLFAFRADEMSDQAATFTGVGVDSRFEALRRVRNTLHVAGETDVLAICGRWPVCPERFGDAGGLDLPLTLALLGCGLLLIAVWRERFSGRATAAMAVFGAQAALVVFGLRTDFPRYHLPILLAVAVLDGVCAGYLARGVAAGFARVTRVYDTK